MSAFFLTAVQNIVFKHCFICKRRQLF